MTDLSGFLKAQLIVNDRDNAIRNMAILTVLELLTGFISKLWNSLEKYIKSYIDKKMNNVELNISKNVGIHTNTLYFERDWKTSGDWDRADALLHYILNIPNAKEFLIVAQLEIIQNGNPFNLTKNVIFEMTKLRMEDGVIESIAFKVSSDILTICELRDFVNDILEKYIIEQKNNLGNKLYYFDHVVQNAKKRGDYINKLLFSQHLFRTNRTLDNVFHERQEELKHRVTFFLENKEWYDQRGIPYTLGLMLHGLPGTGKTSSIKAVANVAQRHIFNINLAAIKSQKQLKKLFYDEKVVVCPDPEAPSRQIELIIPIEKRMYIVEDADALIESDILKKREDSTTLSVPIRSKPKFSHEIPDEEESDIDLSTILNIIDGSLETPGRILIISSNHPEKFDSAFIRPGRIDMLIEYKLSNHKVIKDMFKSFYDENIDEDKVTEIEEYKWSPAEVSQILFKNFGNSEQALQDLISLDKSYFEP
jgi:hypothetical protein